MGQLNLGARVVVVGGSISGLITAYVLSEYFGEVVVVDKDRLGTYPSVRKMVPQSNHVHIVLKAGEDALNDIFPGFSAEMVAAGSVVIDMSKDMLSCSALGVAAKWSSGIRLLSQSRSLLEQGIFDRVSNSNNNIIFRQNTSVLSLNYDDVDNRIVGLKLKTAEGPEELSADLVVDASGRGAYAMRWLRDLNLPLPDVDEVRVVVGYGSCKVKLRERNKRAWNGVECGGPVPEHLIAGMIMPIEEGLHICSVTSRFGDFPPTNEAEFRQYTKKFPHRSFADAIADAEIVSPILKTRYESSKFRRYDKMHDLPKGFIPIGDSFCSVNPAYGQGMSSSILQSQALKNVLSSLTDLSEIDCLPKKFLDKASKIAERVWINACLKDFRYPKTQASAVFVSAEDRAYHEALEKLSIIDPKLRLQLMRLNHLLDDPAVLNSSEVSAKVDTLLGVTG